MKHIIGPREDLSIKKIIDIFEDCMDNGWLTMELRDAMASAIRKLGIVKDKRDS